MIALTMTWQAAMLLQTADPDQSLKWILVGGIVLCIVAMGLPFFRNAFYAITAPTYSLRNMGGEDNLFFSILLVFMGGLFVSLYALLQKAYMADSFLKFANAQIGQTLASYSNATYKPILFNEGVEKMMNAYYTVESLVFWLWFLWILLWLVSGVVFWFLTKAFGNQGSLKVMLSTQAYAYMLSGAIVGFFYFRLLGAFLASGGASPALGTAEMVGAVLLLASVVYLIIAVAQGGEVSSVQAIIVFLIAAILLAGVVFFAIYQVKPIYQSFLDELRTRSFV